LAACGVALAAWAREHGIDGRSLNAWRVNFSRSGEPAPKQQRARLVELVPAPASAAGASARYSIQCGELTVEVDERFDDATLSRLVRVVATC
jgi:transposase-like protein